MRLRALALRRRVILAAVLALGAGAGAAAAVPAQAVTVTCLSCIHVQNVYAFRGALDAVHQATAVNSKISLWYETPTTTDAGADIQVVSAGTVVPALQTADFGVVNQSHVNWVDYEGDSVVRFRYDPFGNGGANTFIGLNGQMGDGTSVALRKDNPNSVWQEFIEVPVNALGQPNGNNNNGGINNLGGVANACGNPVAPTASAQRCVLIDVGQTQNPNDPFILTDPDNAFTGSLVQQKVQQATINQFDAVSTDQVWVFRN
jgi:hypothetical protein